MKQFTWIPLIIALTACGGGGGGGNSSTTDNLSTATSQLCTTLAGIEAVYWDFINAVPRSELAFTNAFTIPSNFTPTVYSNSVSLLLGFTSIPQGWTIQDGADISGFALPGTVAAADMMRSDNQAFWRYMFSSQVTGGYTSAAILDAEINTALNFFGNPTITTEECQINLQQNGIIGLESVSARVVRAGNFTFMARAHIIIPTGGLTGFYDGFLSVAPTAENPTQINDVFIPMITQLYGGGSDPTECEDGIDNDGDTKVDLLDPNCESPSDDNESS